MTFMSEVINGDPEQPTTPVTEVEPPKEEPKGEEVSTTPVQKLDEAKPPETVPVAALKAEREKRQALEAQLRALQEQQRPVQEPPKEDEFAIFDDPRAVLERQKQEVILQTSAMIARAKHEDFDEKATTFFQEMAQQNPALVDAMLRDQNPAEFVYREAKKYNDMREFSDPETYKAKLRAELEQQIRAELSAQSKPHVPPDLASLRSAGGNTTKPNWDGPTPMRDILTRR